MLTCPTFSTMSPPQCWRLLKEALLMELTNNLRNLSDTQQFRQATTVTELPPAYNPCSSSLTPSNPLAQVLK